MRMKYREEMIVEWERGYCMGLEEREGKDVEMWVG